MLNGAAGPVTLKTPVRLASIERITQAEIAHIDKLDELIRVAGRQDFPAPGHARRPVGEAVRGIVGTDDQTGAHVEHAPGHGRFCGLLAERLERAVCFAVDLLNALVCQCTDIRRLGDAGHSVIGIDGNAGDERVVLHAAGQQLSRRPNQPRHIAAGVDDRVPLAAFQRTEIAVTVAA